MQTVAFIGLGNMGSGMCANLVKAGLQVMAYDLSASALEHAVKVGAGRATSIAEAVAQADAVITMLPAGEHVLSVYFDEKGVSSAAKPGTLFLDCSTISVDDARLAARRALEAGFSMVDAPVSGGTAAAAAGTLTFMGGGEQAAFDRARPILESMGKNIFHAGQNGNGQAAKIANNMLLGISMIGTSEAFVLAEKLGLDAQTFFDISSKASGQNWSMTSYCPAPGPVPAAPSNNDYKAGFAVAMMLKDLKLAADAADGVDAQTPLGNYARDLYERLSERGFGALDFSAIIEDLNGKL